jgi:hypothetical protein
MTASKNEYVIRLNDEGYFGRRPYTAMPKTEATIFPSMKDARKQLNRINGRLWKGLGAIIEPLIK